MGAEMMKIPELELDKDESQKLADAIADVSKYYVTAFDPKKVAWVHLAVIAGGIYGTRIFAFRNRKQLENKLHSADKIASQSSTKPQAFDSRVQSTSKPNGAISKDTGKVEVDPNFVWGMTSGEI